MAGARLSALNADLARELGSPPGCNTMFSALSLDMALVALGGGAAGQTLAELEAALRWGPGSVSAALADAVSAVKDLEMAARGGELVISVANGLFSRVPVKQDYVTALSSTGLKATCAQLASADQVNAWVALETNGMIRSLVTEQAVASSLLLVVNALYFKGAWLTKFDPSLTRAAHFFAADRSLAGTCMLMESKLQEWGYHEDATAQYALLPYRGAGGLDCGTAALVVLPRDPANAAVLASVDTAHAVAKCLAAKRRGRVFLPRFRAEGELALKGPLQRLGVASLFSAASLPRISDQPLVVEEVLQRVVVDVGEEGTEAAAATAVLVFGAAPPQDAPFEMRCDRPFAFLVVHAPHSGPAIPLFAGTITNPTGAGAGGGGKAAASAFSQPSPFSQAFFSPPQPAPATASAFSQPSPFSQAFLSPPRPAAPAASAFPQPAPLAQPLYPPQPPPPTPSSQLSVEERAAQQVLFTPACKRDMYRVLCAPPRAPLAAPAPPPAPAPPAHTPLRWCLDEVACAFVPAQRDAPDPRAARTLALLESAGHPRCALTPAFERLLAAEYVPWWGDGDAAGLSAAFLFAFGAELTPRLDLHHALRSRRLGAAEVAWLRGLPAGVHFERRLLDVFQGDT